MQLIRSPGWERRLARVTEKHISLPGEWGVSDCLLTMADAVEAVTETDIMVKWRGKYKTEAGAAKLMKKNGCDTVEDVLRDFFRLPPVGRLSARRGDVGIVLQGGQPTAGYVCEYGFAAKGPRGLTFHDLTDIVTAFKVG
jgi:hypothetical protein